MTTLDVEPGGLFPLGREVVALAGRVAPGSLADALSAGVAALGGLSSGAALEAVAAVWVPQLRVLADDWRAWGDLVLDAGVAYDRVEREVERAAS